MLSIAEGIADWPLTSRVQGTNLSFSHLGRSLSTPTASSDSSDNSENASPVVEITLEQVFVTISTVVHPKILPVKENQIQGNSIDVSVKILEAFQVPNINKMEVNTDNIKKKKKKKKWKTLEISEFSFNMSLLPRPSRNSNIDEKEVHRILNQIDEEYLSTEEKLSPYRHLLKFEGNRLEDKFVRSDRDRKIRKAHKQVKDKHCLSIRNNNSRKQLYVHHRVMKLMNLEEKRSYLHYPHPASRSLLDAVDSQPSCLIMQGPLNRQEPQNLAHALHSDNVDMDLPTDLISLLITLQHRDISPEDYEVLLRLDESVAPKTISDEELQAFQTDVVDEVSAAEVCSVCMDRYEVGQARKYLPCGHVFHDACIDMWLKNSSLNCPLDGLPVVVS